MKTKIENIDELKSVLSNKEKTVSSIEHFMQPFNLGRTLKNYSNIKQQGFSFTEIDFEELMERILNNNQYEQHYLASFILCKISRWIRV